MRMLKLESFNHEPEPAPSTAGDQALTAARAASYDEGYSAGWQDAQLSQAAQAETLRAEALRQLQDLSFTFHESRAHILRGMGPFVTATVAQVLPSAAQRALPHLLAEALKPYWELAADQPVQLETAPETLPHIQALLDMPGTLPCTIRLNPDLALGQIRLRLGSNETSIDPATAITQVMTLIETFFAPTASNDPKDIPND